MDYYKRYMGDYGRDTSRLSMIEHGAYNLLLDDYYSTRTPLPEDLNELYRICRATTKPEQGAVDVVAKRFFPVCSDGLRHSKRADQEIAKWEVMAEENREKGKLGGRPKKNPNGNPARNPPGNQTGSGGDNPDETHRVIGGLGKEGVLETRSESRRKPSPAPIPNPNPETRSHSHAQERAREGANGSVVADPEGVLVDSLPYEQAIQATFPKGPNPTNWILALRHARRLVELGKMTWPALVAAVERFAAFIAAGGVSDPRYIRAAHNFFDPDADYWAQDWAVPRTKAEVRQDGNIEAARQWLAQSADES